MISFWIRYIQLVKYSRLNFCQCSICYCNLHEFCKDKPTIYFSALNSTSKENLEELSKAIHLLRYPDTPNAPIYSSYGDALDDAITELAKEQRLVFVIDEYPSYYIIIAPLFTFSTGSAMLF